MILTTKQALSFVEATSKGAPKHFFDALLGTGQTPKVDDFTSDDAEGLEKAEEFLGCVQAVTDTLSEHLRYHPRQTSLLTEFDKQAKKPTPKEVCEAFHPGTAKKKPKTSMQKFKDSIGKKPAKKKPTQKPAAKKPTQKPTKKPTAKKKTKKT